MRAEHVEKLVRLRATRDRVRHRLIEIELEIAGLVSHRLVADDDPQSEIAEAEERGDWIQAARLRAACGGGIARR